MCPLHAWLFLGVLFPGSGWREAPPACPLRWNLLGQAPSHASPLHGTLAIFTSVILPSIRNLKNSCWTPLEIESRTMGLSWNSKHLTFRGKLMTELRFKFSVETLGSRWAGVSKLPTQWLPIVHSAVALLRNAILSKYWGYLYWYSCLYFKKCLSEVFASSRPQCYPITWIGYKAHFNQGFLMPSCLDVLSEGKR